MPSTTAPPTSGPNATARPAIPPQAPSASPRCSGGDRGAEDRQRQRHHDRAAETLHGPGGVEQLDGRRERRGDRAEREDRDADREDPAPAEAVAERRARSSSTAKVSVYALTVHSRLSSDASRSSRMTGMAVGHDEVVERDHEQRDRGDHERPEGAACGSSRAPFHVSVVSDYFVQWRKKGSRRTPPITTPSRQASDETLRPGLGLARPARSRSGS